MFSPRQSPHSTKQQPSRARQPRTNQTEVVTPNAPGSQDPPNKKRHLNRETTETPHGNQQSQSGEARQTPVLSTTTTQVGTSSLIGKIEHGQTTQISGDEVLGYKDLPVEAYEFSALLRLGTTYELMDFLVRTQVVVGARMAEEHEETRMIQRALTGELEPHKDRALQKIGWNKQEKSPPSAHGPTRSKHGLGSSVPGFGPHDSHDQTVGWGVKPRMASPPSQGGLSVGGREREKKRRMRMTQNVRGKSFISITYPIGVYIVHQM